MQFSNVSTSYSYSAIIVAFSRQSAATVQKLPNNARLLHHVMGNKIVLLAVTN